MTGGVGLARRRVLAHTKPSKTEGKAPGEKLTLDIDYLAFAILMGAFGVVGITATASVSPNILASPGCNCIPSPEARLQELSVVLLAIAVVLAPIGVWRKQTVGGVRSFAYARRGKESAPAAPLMRSGGLFFLGISLVVLGAGLVAIPSFLVLGSPILIAEGAAMVVFGLFLARRGGRRIDARQ